MTDKQIITDGCEFQGDCIEYKDISYLKIMPICAIHELSIACHDKVNKCKYYKLYKQLKRKEQELQQAMDNYVQLDLQRVKEYNELVDLYKAKEQECEELKKQLQAQRAFTRHEQKLIYCVAYDETCKTGNDCKQEKCIFKDNIKLKQTLTEIKDYCNKYPQNSIGFKKYILQKINECEANQRK